MIGIIARMMRTRLPDRFIFCPAEVPIWILLELTTGRGIVITQLRKKTHPQKSQKPVCPGMMRYKRPKRIMERFNINTTYE
jgi:hypothetical protein